MISKKKNKEKFGHEKAEKNREKIFEKKLHSEEVSSVATEGFRTVFKDKKKKFVFWGGLCFLLIIILTCFGIFTAQKSDVVDRGDYPIYYMTEEGIYTKKNGQVPVLLSGYITSEKIYNKTIQAKASEYTYFLENYNAKTENGTLFITKNGRKKEMIAYNVSSSLACSDKGKEVLFLENMDLKQKTGDLYLANGFGTKIAIDINILKDEYVFSPNGKYLIYNKKNDLGTKDLYAYFDGKSTRIDENITGMISVSDKKKVFYFKGGGTDAYESDLYYCDEKCSPTKVASNVYIGYVGKSKSLNSIAFLSGKINERVFSLNYFDEKQKKSVVDTNVSAVFYASIEEGKFVYSKNKTPKNSMGELYIVYSGYEPIKISDSVYNQSQVSVSKDFDVVIYLEEYDVQNKIGVLCKKVFEKGAEGSKEVIDKDVRSFEISDDGKVVAYVKNLGNERNGDLYFYKNSKSTFVNKDVHMFNYKLLSGGEKIYYITTKYSTETTNGELFEIDTRVGDSVNRKIDDNVYSNYYFRGDGSIVYYKNYNTLTERGELCVYKNSKKKYVSNNVSVVLFEYSKKY